MIWLVYSIDNRSKAYRSLHYVPAMQEWKETTSLKSDPSVTSHKTPIVASIKFLPKIKTFSNIVLKSKIRYCDNNTWSQDNQLQKRHEITSHDYKLPDLLFLCVFMYACIREYSTSLCIFNQYLVWKLCLIRQNWRVSHYGRAGPLYEKTSTAWRHEQKQKTNLDVEHKCKQKRKLNKHRET